VSRIAETNAWKEALVGGKPILPFHAGSVKSRIDAGRSLSERASVLYATTRTRPEVPTQRPSGSRYFSATRSRTSSGSVASSPSPAAAPSDPASWAKKRSAGLESPSSASVAASSALSP
jgi:hypothetical protein